MINFLEGRLSGLFVLLSLLSSTKTASAQSGPYCSFLGPIFPPPVDVSKSLGPILSAVSELERSLNTLLEEDLSTTNVSFYINAFSSEGAVFGFSHVAPGLEGSLTNSTLNEHTVFRIGSVSKLLTVYALLVELGMDHMNDPVTKWVPELADSASHSCINASDVTTVNWTQVTIGALASHMAGISRDLSLQDLSLFYNETITDSVGLPPPEPPTCGTSTILPPCNRSEIFNGLKALHPITASFNTPIYSNIAFQILAYALEGTTNTSFENSFERSLVKPLNLSRTSLEAPIQVDNAIIPGGEAESWWSTKTGDASPFGGMFSTASDLATLGRSILSSSLLAPEITRAWLKPVTETADLRLSVGMPWEIRRMELPLTESLNTTRPATRIVDLYTKNGDLGSYTTFFVLSPDHRFGYSILLASPVADTTTRNVEAGILSQLMADTLVPAFEEAARQQAKTNFAGTYASTDTDNVTTTLSLIVEEGKAGLGVSTWTRNQVDLLQMFALVSGIPLEYAPSLRLYPMGLESNGQKAFRGVYEALPVAGGNGIATEMSHGVFTGGCLSWGAVDTPQYGNVGFDDFVFDVDEKGAAVAVTPRVMRKTLSKHT